MVGARFPEAAADSSNASADMVSMRSSRPAITRT